MGGLVARKFLVKNESLLAEQHIEIGLFLVASPSIGSKVANIGLSFWTCAAAFASSHASLRAAAVHGSLDRWPFLASTP